MSTSPDDEVAAPEQSDAEAVRAAVTPPPQTVRTRLDYNRTTGRFDVMAGGVVVGEATSYLEVEVRHG